MTDTPTPQDIEKLRAALSAVKREFEENKNEWPLHKCERQMTIIAALEAAATLSQPMRATGWLERVARAICIRNGYDPDDAGLLTTDNCMWEEYIPDAQAAMEEFALMADRREVLEDKARMTRAEDERLRQKWSGIGTKDWNGLDD